MEGSQWNKLPDDLQIRVLSRLPILDLRRLSFTCRYFHSLLSDPSFAVHYDRSFLGHPMFFLMSDFLEQHTQSPYFRSIILQEGWPEMLTWKNPLLHDLPDYQWRRSLTCGDGFLCFEGFIGPISSHNISHENTKLLVVNPIFSQERRILNLPAMANSVKRFYTGIAFDRHNGVCKLILWHMSEAFNFVMTTFIYNLKESMWKRIPEWNGIPNYSCSLSVLRRPQLVSERYLCWLANPIDTASPGNTVFVFDVEEEIWRDPIPFPPTPQGHVLLLFIFEHKKRLCMISKTYEKGSLILVLWKFHMEERIWRRAESIPPPHFRFQDVLAPEMAGRGFWGAEYEDFYGRHVSIYDMSRNCWENMGEFQPAIVMEPSFFRLVY